MGEYRQDFSRFNRVGIGGFPYRKMRLKHSLIGIPMKGLEKLCDIEQLIGSVR